jgi:predicted transcriptional regulator
VDWHASGLPTEGTLTAQPHALDVTRLSVPRCEPRERLGEVRARVRHEGWDQAIVVDDAGVVLGVVTSEALDGDTDTPVERVMEGGPRTIRPSVLLEKVDEYVPREADRVLVTNPDGVLIGTLFRADVERRLREEAAA